MTINSFRPPNIVTSCLLSILYVREGGGGEINFHVCKEGGREGQREGGEKRGREREEDEMRQVSLHPTSV